MVALPNILMHFYERVNEYGSCVASELSLRWLTNDCSFQFFLRTNKMMDAGLAQAGLMANL